MMPWRRHSVGLVFSCVFVVSFFTNKFVLSVLNFTFPTLFQGWQTLIGAILLLLSGRLGMVEMSRITRSAALSWLPGALLFVGNIYAGSRALARLDIPLFFTLQNSSHVVSLLILKVIHRERVQRLKLFRLGDTSQRWKYGGLKQRSKQGLQCGSLIGQHSHQSWCLITFYI
uniref:Transmembrane protein 241 n=1 Tax=Labrus bergylta TaxID=56723 RepID=A0A3Q3GTT0_9LABR